MYNITMYINYIIIKHIKVKDEVLYTHRNIIYNDEIMGNKKSD